MKPDLDKAINMVISTGKVKLGFESVMKQVLTGKAKATILSNNVPNEAKERLLKSCEMANIPVIVYDKSGTELGAICGRPHKVSSIVVLDPGNSKILDYIE
ncbi:MAG: 50S ribosomal protein L30e [Candidatus Hodarchaeales archaeon]